MKRLLAAVLSLSLILGPAVPAQANEGGRDPVETAVEKIALVLTMNQIAFTPTQIILMIQNRAYGIFPPEDVKQFREGKGGLFGSLFSANKKKVFEELARRNFVNKVGRAYRIGDMVFIDSMFFDTGIEEAATAAGREALQNILNGNSFILGPAKNPFAALFQQQILALMFFMRSTEGMRMIYRLEPKMNEVRGIEGVKAGKPLAHPITFLAFFAAIASGKAQPLGDVWQIGDKVVISAPLDEIFPAE